MNKLSNWIDVAASAGLALILYKACAQPLSEVTHKGQHYGYQLWSNKADDAKYGEWVVICLSLDRRSIHVIIECHRQWDTKRNGLGVIATYVSDNLVGAVRHACNVITGNLSYQEAIIVAKNRGITVEHGSTPGAGDGYYSSPLGCSWSYVGPCSSEEIAWQQAVERMALVKPGVTVFTSREYGNVTTANVLCSDGSIGFSHRRSRIEVRHMGCHYELFTVDRLYMRGNDSRDIWQARHECYTTRSVCSFTPCIYMTQSEAEMEVAKFIDDYEGTAAEEMGYAAAVLREQQQLAEHS